MTYFLRHGERAPSQRSAANSSHSAPATPNTHISTSPMPSSLLFLPAERFPNISELLGGGRK